MRYIFLFFSIFIKKKINHDIFFKNKVYNSQKKMKISKNVTQMYMTQTT